MFLHLKIAATSVPGMSLVGADMVSNPIHRFFAVLPKADLTI